MKLKKCNLYMSLQHLIMEKQLSEGLKHFQSISCHQLALQFYQIILFYQHPVLQNKLKIIICITFAVKKHIQKNQMLKPKAHPFKLRFHLAKLEAMNNKVSSKVHAYLHIQNNQLQFKTAPQLKKNLATFNSQLQFDSYLINYDEVTGLYQNKFILVVIEFETQGAYVKVGEVNINLGSILNQKKYRVVNTYPLAKCYDKTAKIKLSVDFIPLSEKPEAKQIQSKYKSNVTVNHQYKQDILSPVNNMNLNVSNFKSSNIKSRLAQQQNVILQQKIYEYEKRMDNYRMGQTELADRMHQQVQKKDQKISQLSMDLSKLQNTIHLISLQNESNRNQIRQISQQNGQLKQQIKRNISTIQLLQKNLSQIQKQFQSKKISLENLSRTKQNKQKHLSQQIQKYTLKYSQSEQERNKIIFQLEHKLKEQLEKKDSHYQDIIKENDKKSSEIIKALKQKVKIYEKQISENNDKTDQNGNQISKLKLELEKSRGQISLQGQQITRLHHDLGQHKKRGQTLSNQIQTLNFSYLQIQTEMVFRKEQLKSAKKSLQQIKTQLALATQTIQQQRQRLNKYNKQLQVHQQRQYYMKQRYEDELQIKYINQECILGEKQTFREEIVKLKRMLKLSQQKAQEEKLKVSNMSTMIENFQTQITSKNKILMQIGEQKIYMQNQSKNLKRQIQELEEGMLMLKDQNNYLSQSIVDRKIAQQNQKNLQWGYKIQNLQNDISQMVEKFKVEKENMKEHHRKEDFRKTEEISRIMSMNRKLNQQMEEIKKVILKKDSQIISLDKTVQNFNSRVQQLERQVISTKENAKAYQNQSDLSEQKAKQLLITLSRVEKEHQQIQNKQQKSNKRLQNIKSGFNRLLSTVLEYMVKPHHQRITFQQINLDNIEGEIVGYVNLAIKKFCEDHNKVRDLIKDLQEQKKAHNQSSPRKSQQSQNLIYKSQANQIYNEQTKTFNLKSVASQKQFFTSPLYPNQDPTQQLQAFRYQIGALKKQISEYKVKIKNMDEQIEKQEKYYQQERFQTSKLKTQLEDSQDQQTRLNFAIRKKDKIIKQMELQLKDLQKEIFGLKSNSNNVSPQKIVSNKFQMKRSSQEHIIKDMQSKLTLKNAQVQHYMKQIQSLREQILSNMNQAKKQQAKIKQRNNRIIQLQRINDKNMTQKEKELQKQLNKQLKKSSLLQGQIQEKQKKIYQLQKNMQSLQKNLQDMQRRNRQLQDYIRGLQNEVKKSNQQTVYAVNDKSTGYETTIMQLKAQGNQLKQKINDLQTKNSHLSAILQKKHNQNQVISRNLSKKQEQLNSIEQQFNSFKNKAGLKNSELQDRIRQVQNQLQGRSYELQECRFGFEGKVLDLERQIQDFRKGVVQNKYIYK